MQTDIGADVLGVKFATLVELLGERARNEPRRPACSFLGDGERIDAELTYGELDAEARRIAGRLQAEGAAGERALLLFPPGLEFVTAFLGCLYAGVVAVPAYPPGSRRTLPRLASITHDARPALVLTRAAELERFSSLAARLPELARLRWLASDAAASDDPGSPQATSFRRAAPAPDDIAFLQYTSGSTATPKGVMVSHANLVANEETIRRAFATSADSVVVGWLPVYHDMGLIGNVLQPLYVGARCLLMPPLAFLRKPIRWLRAISRFRATVSGGPNFAYELCVDKISAEERAELDLACWRVAFNGAEPVRPATLERFAASFAECGFERRACYPCYGLAEATLFVTGGDPATPPVTLPVAAEALERGRAEPPAEISQGRALAGCGVARHDTRLAIVDQETARPCAPRRVGEIWIAGPSVARGYWQRSAETATTFGAYLDSGAGPFLRTGDLGFLDGGELFVTGRAKDLVILRGRNLYPQDVEWTAERSHPALRPGGGAAFSVDLAGEERLVVVHEVERRQLKQASEAAEALRRAVAEEHEARLHEVVLVRPGAVPKTSSGKVRRRRCRTAYLAGEIAPVFTSALDVERVDGGEESPDEAILTREALLACDGAERRAAVTAYLAGEVARVARVERSRIDPRRPLTVLGLDSLAAVELQHRMESELEVSLAFADLLADTSLEQLVEEVLAQLEQTQLGQAPQRTGLPLLAPGEAEVDAPLSPGQKALWFLARLAPESTAYHLASAVRVRSALDTAALGRAFTELAERHPSLRTTFHDVAGEPCQRLASNVIRPLEIEDATAWSEERIGRRLQELAWHTFDLERGPLCRLTLLACPGGEHRWVLALHHLVADLWSFTVLVRDLGELYARQAAPGGNPEPPAGLARVRYGDWVRWQREALAGPEGERLEAYWRARLDGVPQVLDLPTDRPRPPIESFRGARRKRRLDAALYAAAHARARQSGATVYMVLLAAFQELLGRYSAQRSFLVGSPTAGRRLAEVQEVVGYFVNPLPLPADLSGQPTGREILARVRRGVLADFAHQDYPFPFIVERLAPERAASGSSLVQAAFALQRPHRAEAEALAACALGWDGVELDLGGCAVESIAVEPRGAPFDLTLLAAEWDGRLGLTLDFNTDLRDAVTAERLLDHFETLVSGFLADPDRRLADLDLLGNAERVQLVREWNDTATGYPRSSTVPELFAARAAMAPDLVALRQGESATSYGELERRSESLARVLRARGVGPEVPVGLCQERDMEMVVASLAVLKAGGAYVPLDPEHPPERLAFMLEDAGARVVVVGRSLRSVLPDSLPQARLISPEEEGPRVVADGGAAPPAAEAGNLAYLMYTSGSTGRPKGVAVTHRNIVRLVRETDYVDLGPGDRVAQAANTAFDAATFELWGALLNGASLVLMPRRVTLDPKLLAEEIRRRRLTTMFLTTALFHQVAREEPAAFATLGHLLFGGETVDAARVRELVAGTPPRRLLHVYGPTESTTFATWHRVREVAPQAATVPIGRALANTTVDVVDREQRPLPIGVVGELAIGGDGLARGYFERPATTAGRFVPDGVSGRPSGGRPGARLYSTGDLARRIAGGAVEFLGRLDHQVKIRGFRIEPGEIEAVLAGQPEVAAAAVLVRGAAGDRRLVAYLAVKEPAPEVAELGARLRETLPAYMVPAAIVRLAELPLNPNGKVDRAALAALSLPAGGEDDGSDATPRTALEELLAGIWSEVLGVARVGVHQSFFDLGGHSLNATRVVARVREVCGVELPLRCLFEAPTIAALARTIAARGETAPSLPPLTKVARGTALEASFAQERLWFLDRLQPGGASYNVPAAVRLSGELAYEVLAAGLAEVVRRHEALRTGFVDVEGRPRQVVAPRLDLRTPLVDLAAIGPQKRAVHLPGVLASEGRRAFDLAAPPLVRAVVFRLASREHVLLLTMHHIVSDGWSLGVLVDEITTLYRAALEAGGDVVRSPLPELPVQYGDYSAWQRGWLTGEVLERQVDYWRAQLAGIEALELATDRPRPAVRRERGAALPVALPADLSESLTVLSRRRGVTRFMTLSAAFATLLGRYSAQPEVTVGTPVAHRRHRELEGLIGFFVNTLVLRFDLSSDPGFSELLDRTRQVALAADAHQDVPFEKLVEELAPARDLARTPFFQVMLAFMNAPFEDLHLPGLEIEPIEVTTGTAKFDLTLALEETARGAPALTGSLEYDRDLFDASTVERLRRHFETLLGAALSDPRKRLSELELLPESERRQVLESWNDTHVRYRPACLHHAFEARAEATPDSVALCFGAAALTYRELDREANRLAHRLIALGVEAEDRVGILMERSLELVIALFATLKAGGAYVPLDPSYPPSRLAFMALDSARGQATSVVLTQAALAERVESIRSAARAGATRWRVLAVDAEHEVLASASAARPEVAVGLDHAAYAIYTSGSTGRPKGVVNSHRGISNRLDWMQETFGLTPADRVLQKTPFSFDVSVWEFFWPLMTGARLVVARPGGHQDPAYLTRSIREQGVTTLHFVPSMLQVFVEEPGVETLTSPRRIVASGEALPAELVRRFYERTAANGPQLHNLYGPTEAAVDVTWWPCPRRHAAALSRVPIGRPVANTALCVLDRSLGPVPIGIAGELHLGGVQLARGYLGRPGLTAEKFVPDPFAGPPAAHPVGGRLYKTGDLARWLGCGEVEYLGRIDFQVKIRGLRIELGEIETALADHPAVRDAVVMVRTERAEPQLVAYVTARRPAPSGGIGGEDGDGSPALDPEALRRHSSERLPSYMVPTVVVLEALPLLANGKVDRNALSRRALPAAPGRVGEWAAPHLPAEEVLAGIWSDLLGLEGGVGRHDDFFEIGGHSLLATRVVSRVRAVFGREIELRRFFETPTVHGLAAALAEADTGLADPPLRPIAERPDRGPLPLSFAQSRLWFLDQVQPGQTVYSIGAPLVLRGGLDAAALAASFAALTERHESLRTSFPSHGGEPVQAIAPPTAPPLPLIDLSALPAPRRAAEAREQSRRELTRAFDLARGPLFRTSLLRLEEGVHHLWVAMHHIISDGWSVGVLVRETAELYGACTAGRRPRLPALPVQYADYAVWQRELLAGERLEALLAFWRRTLAGAPPLYELPTDRPRPRQAALRGASCALMLPPESVAPLESLARRSGATHFMVLLAVFETLLVRSTGEDDVVVGTPVANRHRGEVEGLIGFFVNTLVLRGDLSGDPLFSQLVSRLRTAVLAAWAHQEMPFERLVEALRPERHASYSPLFQMMFALNNAPQEKLELGDLALEQLDFESATAQFDLTLELAETRRGLGGKIEYDRELFDATRMRRLAHHFEVLLGAVLVDPERPLSQLPLMSAAQSAQLIVEANDTGGAGPPRPAGTLFDRVAATAAHAPDAVAAVFDPGGSRLLVELTYGELVERARRLGARLRARGVGPEARVGVALRRSPEVPVALLGVFAAGGAYVPLDPDYPRPRLRFLVEDAEVALVVTDEACRSLFPDTAIRTVPIDGDGGDGEEAVPAAVEPGNAAYVIYTSGSTGRPKGVVIPHGELVRHLAWLAEGFLELGPGDVMLQITPYSFDASLWELLVPLLAGGRVVWPESGRAQDPAHLVDVMERSGVTRLQAVPSLLELLLEEPRLTACASLRTIYAGSEELSAELAERCCRRLGLPLLNAYGPTEATIEATIAKVGKTSRPSAPIGRPVAGAQLYVTGAGLEPAPLGVAGELLIGGAGLARGYHRRPALTAEKFVADPFSPAPGARLYKSGDLVRHLPDGELEFLGRIDHQVKVRGVRIELGEIEAALRALPEVQEAVLMARAGDAERRISNRRLVAYVTPRGSAELAAAGLRDDLRTRLPEYLVPAAFVVLDALPLTTSGKVDRRALPEPVRTAAAAAYVAPRSSVEEMLAMIWSELLDVERVGIHDNFFELGGHSLAATRLISRLSEVLGVELELRRLFETPTIAALAAAVEELRATGQGLLKPALEPAERHGELPLSFAQERLWFLDQMEPGSAAYNVAGAVELDGQLDVAALEAGFADLVRRHETLRTRFANRRGGPVQLIEPEHRSVLEELDLAALGAADRQCEVERLTAAEAARPFDLERGPLLRTTLLRRAADRHTLLLTMHHIVSDGVSMEILIREAAALYSAFSRGRPASLVALPVQYADFTIWQRQWLRGEVLERQLAWWRDRLDGGPALLELPADRPRPALRTPAGGALTERLPAALSRAVRTLARHSGLTLYMTLLAAFKGLLRRHTQRDDLVVGSTVAGRDRQETSGLIGFFVNTLALRTDLSGDPSFTALLERVRSVALGAYAHQDLPFEKLVEELRPQRTTSHAPLVQVIFQQFQAAPRLELPGLRLSVLEAESHTAKFDLVVNMVDEPEALVGVWRYSSDLFDRSTIHRMARHFARLLASAVAEADRPLSRLALLTAAEEHQVRSAWNTPWEAKPAARSLAALFAAAARRDPSAPAVLHDGERLTYGELDRSSGQLARHLGARGVGRGSLVGLYLERSPELVTAILGVLKAGAAYVPLDPIYPEDRVAFVLEDTAVPVVLTHERLRSALPANAACEVIPIDGEWPAADRQPAGAPEVGVEAGDLAYVIYTSGSTGRPKGVAVTHGHVLRLLAATEAAFGFSAGDVWTLFHSYAFDFSVWEIWGALAYGGSVVVVPYWVSRSPETFYQLVAETGVTVLNQTPSAFRQFIRADESAAGRLALRWVIFGGEALELRSLEPWFERHGDGMSRGDERDGAPRLVNMYGITETTVHVTWRPLGRADLVGGSVIGGSVIGGSVIGGSVIGRPISDLTLHLLDPRLVPVPIGVAGEIFVGGAGVARGYLNRPTLSAERFVPDPFAGEDGARLYRSGDLARFLPGGDLEYLGRIDHQVQIRGFRIELGEIEENLAAHPAVGEAVVLAEGERSEDLRLVACVVAAGEEMPGLGELRPFLARRLPDYMLPSGLVTLERLPLTAHGKVDRAALSRAAAAQPELAEGEVVAPQNPVERYLADLWRETLELADETPISVDADFFELGGNSIRGAVLINRLQQDLDEIVQVVTIFDATTVRALARYLVTEHPRAVARRFGEEALGEKAGTEQPERRVDAARVAELRGLLASQPLSEAPPRETGRNPPAIFVLAPPRSGTTLLRVMLGGHPRLFAPPELELLSYSTLAERQAAYAGRDSFWLEGLLRAVMEIHHCDAETAHSIVAQHTAEGLTTRDFYGRLQAWLGSRRLVDKTPSYSLRREVLERAERDFDEPFYIHLVRHPGAVIRSFEEAKLDQIFMRFEHPFERRELAELVWLVSHQNILRFLETVPAARQLRLTFEELVADPATATSRLCHALGLDFDPRMVDPYEEDSARMTDGLHAESRMLGDVKFHQHRQIETAAAERWKEHVDEHLLGEVTWELAGTLGYERPESDADDELARLAALEGENLDDLLGEIEDLSGEELETLLETERQSSQDDGGV